MKTHVLGEVVQKYQEYEGKMSQMEDSQKAKALLPEMIKSQSMQLVSLQEATVREVNMLKNNEKTLVEHLMSRERNDQGLRKNIKIAFDTLGNVVAHRKKKTIGS